METIKNKITVDAVNPHAFKSGLNSAQLRQVIEKVYPSVKPNTGGLFNTSDFNLPEQRFQENRVTWVDVPTDKTVEDVQKQIDSFQDACIWKRLSSRVILTNDELALLDRIMMAEQSSIEKFVLNLTGQSDFHDGLRQEAVDAFMAKKATQQLVVASDGEIIQHNGNDQYRRLFFSLTPHADEDDRSVSYHTALPRVNLQPAEDVNSGVRV